MGGQQSEEKVVWFFVGRFSWHSSKSQNFHLSLQKEWKLGGKLEELEEALQEKCDGNHQDQVFFKRL